MSRNSGGSGRGLMHYIGRSYGEVMMNGRRMSEILGCKIEWSVVLLSGIAGPGVWITRCG